eukprot:CAMPEP_0114331848 /NCGR_PEP_ID=MMETSP0101-20121206/2691_1 /TAXON_ID=38822 ORGANISM="Pteridomonas danica, Strain PT" /NCGR_SAMPLE_ID=MMETSP0101 /ASSEMBLY_ACC=CAM_ASM_000211 /LENGTH=140 /DNA_ID=CAMNT_0001462329 /DNA_START=368 /DNA_END=790 /DNA_ORIENTATION=-
MKTLLSIDEAIQVNKTVLKIHGRILDLAKNYWLSDLNIAASLSLEGPDVILIKSSDKIEKGAAGGGGSIHSPITSPTSPSSKNPLKTRRDLDSASSSLDQSESPKEKLIPAKGSSLDGESIASKEASRDEESKEVSLDIV